MKESVNGLSLFLFGLLPRLVGRSEEAEGRVETGSVTTGGVARFPICESGGQSRGRLSGMGGQVDEEAEEKDAASELLELAESDEEIDAKRVTKKLVGEIVREIEERCKEIAQALVNGSIEGHIQHFKALIEMLERALELQAVATKTVGRSIASAWGAEPEWAVEECAHCSMRAAAA